MEGREWNKKVRWGWHDNHLLYKMKRNIIPNEDEIEKGYYDNIVSTLQRLCENYRKQNHSY